MQLSSAYNKDRRPAYWMKIDVRADGDETESAAIHQITLNSIILADQSINLPFELLRVPQSGGLGHGEALYGTQPAEGNGECFLPLLVSEVEDILTPLPMSYVTSPSGSLFEFFPGCKSTAGACKPLHKTKSAFVRPQYPYYLNRR
ncbi:hypothetical protein FPANT_10247 [Fusarium pseudoanthophilum]|uniref:Uncharacterized protein n=1 Tax=Fusarium pseudoanthophilum TaxID=48495 RepID=A0A8H5KS53_9HYPO|nr:hypothetical protein FPANT_10247 [Fusarium pseudoanthophilum]